MIPTNNPASYVAALAALQQHKASVGRGFKGRFIQIFLGLKFFQNQIPSMNSGLFVETGVLQTMLDDLYSKKSRPLNDCVLMMFEGSYLARTGVVGVGNAGAQNTWRNNFNIQKGVGCYADPAHLATPTFLNQRRVNCQFLSVPGGQLAGKTCTICAAATYRQEDHRKWLRIDPQAGGAYAAIDSSNIPNFLPYVVGAGGRLPIAPIVIALYYDADPGLPLGIRQNVALQDFQSDFNLNNHEYAAYFDPSPANPLNAAVITADANINLAGFNVMQPQPQPQAAGAAAQPVVGAAPLLGTVVNAPAVNTGWGAQGAVIVALQTAGWVVHDVSRQQLGYDLLAKKGVRTIYVEVKSSLGACSPSMTAREWSQAVRLGSAYVLAVVENFKETAPNVVHWIPDPAGQCAASQLSTITHCIHRSSWRQHITAIQAI